MMAVHPSPSVTQSLLEEDKMDDINNRMVQSDNIIYFCMPTVVLGGNK